MVAFFTRARAPVPAARQRDAALHTPPLRDPIAAALLALTGHGTGHLTDRMLISTDPLLHYAGLFAMRPRSANRLGAMVSDWLDRKVEVIEFAGAWLELPPDQRTRIGAYGEFNMLSANAAAGIRAWDPQARIILRIGPLNRAEFESLLPDRLALHRLVSLVRTYAGFEIGFAINLVLRIDAVPPLQLSADVKPSPRLGWNTWLDPLAGGTKRVTDAASARFEAELIEARFQNRGACGMSGWGGGYVTDVPYSIGWYRQQSPVRIAIASILGGSLASIPRGDDPVTMLELGCGLGYTSMLMAASNPSWTVIGVDFNPTHIAIAREWAAEAGLTNITFIEGDFSKWEEDPALRDLPEMDFVTMHGIWSWVPPAAQKGIVRLLAKKVRSGGLVHLSYNSTIGWVELMPVARLIREAGNRVAGRSDHKAQEGIRLVQDLLKAEAQVLHDKPLVASRLELFSRAASDYLAHEFMNEYWAPCFSMDVAAALSEAKLEWVASGELPDNFPELAMTDAQREIFRRYDDPLMQEMIQDICAPRRLRHDIFVRWRRRITPAQRNAALMDVNLTLTKNASQLRIDRVRRREGPI